LLGVTEKERYMKRKPVLVTTEYRGVFFGYAEDTSGETIKLTQARCAIYWPEENKGFVGLAVFGPKQGARIGPPADIELRKVTSVVNITPEAEKVWNEFVW
jgi:hypothetical protein